MSIVDFKKLFISTLVLLSVPLLGLAQEGDAAADEAELEPEERDIEEITVTGSRIKRTEFSTTAPIQVITSERSQLAGLLDASEILQNSTIASGEQINDAFGGFNVEGGVGANSISLRGLGAQRTLVLVNGKRWGPSGTRGATNSVDLTAIPTSMIARYEILKDGASSIYGADAVAGVVNAILKERIDGSQVNAQILTPAEGGSGFSLDGTWGRVGDNWSFNVSGIYGEIDNTVKADHDWSRCDMRPTLDGSNLDPATGEELCFGMLYGGTLVFDTVIGTHWTRWEPSLGDVNDTSNPFWDPTTQGNGIPFWTSVPLGPLPNESTAFYRDNTGNQIADIQPEGSTYSINSFGDYDWSIAGRDATAYYEFYYNHRETDARWRLGYRQIFPTVSGSNPTNPFGFDGLIVVPNFQFADNLSSIEVDRTNTFIGLRGDISASWTYDAYVGYSWSDGTYAGFDILDGQFLASLDAVLDGSGNVVCSPASLALYPDCVAGNLFTEDAMLRGILPQDYLDFVEKRTVGTTEYTSSQFAAYATGPLFEMPAGEFQAVFGVEIRREEIDDQPDIDNQNNNIWGSSTAAITAGSDTVQEFFLEAEVPLLKDMAAAEELTFNASWRYTDYDSYGGDDTYRLALNYTIVPWLRLRGTTGTSFRAPDLFEQFLGNQTGFVNPFIVDPCIDYGTETDPASNLFMNCASQGLALDFPATALPSIETTTGGNPNLVAETSDSTTYGFVLQPETFGVSLAVSWFDIELVNTVASPSIGFVLSDCYESPNLSSPFCTLVGPRDALGSITTVDASLQNVGLLTSKGYDIDILYEREFSTVDLTIDASATYIDEQDRELFGVLTSFDGQHGFPDWVAEMDVRLDWRDWTFFYNYEWIGTTAGTGPANENCNTASKSYSAASVRYRGADWEIIGTMRNIFDEDPPPLGNNCAQITATRFFNTVPGAGYDLMGRAYILQVSKGFDF